MKEIKTFFDKENCLNKGYNSYNNIEQNSQKFLKKNFENILPPVEIMQEYESLYPGTLSKLLNMAEKEQIYRHQQEIDVMQANNNKLKWKNNFVVCGMLSSVLVALTLTNVFSNNIATTIIGNVVILIISALFIVYYTMNLKKSAPINLNNSHNFSKKEHRRYNFKNKKTN